MDIFITNFLRYTKKLGRHVVTNNDIKKGDVLFVEKPYAHTAWNRAKPEVHFNICGFCLERGLHCIPCLECTAFFYCSDKCRKTGWDLGHRWDCLGQRRKIIEYDQQLCLSVLFETSRDGFQPVGEDDSVYGNKENNYPFLNKLLTHKNDVPNEALKLYIKVGVWLVLYLKHFTDYFDWLYVQPNRPEGSQEDLHSFVGGQLVKYSLQLVCNAVAIREGIVRFMPVTDFMISRIAVGHGIYISSALLNHSCLPNTVDSFHGTKRVVKAKQNIKKGTEITIDYSLDTFPEIKTKERQLQLARFSFSCTCQACTDPIYDKFCEPFLCPRCSGKAYQVQEEIFVKCSDCHLIFNGFPHFQNFKKIGELLFINTLLNDPTSFDEIYKLIITVCHKDNALYSIFYTARQEHYARIGDIKKCVDMAKLIVEIFEKLNGDTSLKYALAYTNLSYYLAKYCKTIKNKKSKKYKKLFEETSTVIKKSTDILQYSINNANIKKYVLNMNNYLNFDIDVKRDNK